MTGKRIKLEITHADDGTVTRLQADKAENYRITLSALGDVEIRFKAADMRIFTLLPGGGKSGPKGKETKK